MTERKKGDIHNFYGFNLSDKLIKTLDELKFSKPTPIQAKSIPLVMSGTDLLGVAQTGTGKTLAYGIPLTNHFLNSKGLCLIVTPTRELALQVEDNLKSISKKLGIKTTCLIGGASMNWQLNALKRNPHIIIGTPGRIIDHIQRKTLKTHKISHLVLDEADLMFDMGFAPQVQDIIRETPKTRQTLLYSATMPSTIMKLASRYMKSPIQIEVAPSGTTAKKVDQKIVVVKKEDKIIQIEKILSTFKGSILIFARTRAGVKKLTKEIEEMRHTATDIHSDKSLKERKKALKDFKSGESRIMVATDVAARGIDISGIELVINFDLPEQQEDYVHRIGRTGRAGKRGKAISFALPNQKNWIKKIEELIKKEIPITKLAEFTGNSKPKTKKKKHKSPLGKTPRRGKGRNQVSKKLRTGKKGTSNKPNSKKRNKKKNW